MQPVVDDLINLINNGYIYAEKIIKIRLLALICDAPAKSFVLCIKGHTGFNSCTKCLIKGKYFDRIWVNIDNSMKAKLAQQPLRVKKRKIYVIHVWVYAQPVTIWIGASILRRGWRAVRQGLSRENRANYIVKKEESRPLNNWRKGRSSSRHRESYVTWLLL